MPAGEIKLVNVDRRLLSAALTTFYTIPQGFECRRIFTRLCNTDATTEYLADMHLVPPGQTGTATTQFINQESGTSGMLKGVTVDDDFMCFSPSGTMIQGKANTADKISVGLAIVLEAVG